MGKRKGKAPPVEEAEPEGHASKIQKTIRNCEFRNKERVLIVSSRGITFRYA